MNLLTEIIRGCVINGISVEIVNYPSAADGMAYKVIGFAKSGEAAVFENHTGQIQVNLRYCTVEYISSFEDLANICFRWCEDYKERGYGYDQWATVFEEYGWIKKVTTTSYQRV